MTDILSYVAIDDERKAIALLSRLIAQYYPHLEMTGAYTLWQEGLAAIKKNDFDLLFLDISMPQKTGLNLLELAPQLDAEIVFVTAHEEHALEALNFSPSGYLLKPIDENRLISVVDKAIVRAQHKKAAQKAETEKPLRQTGKICIHSNKGIDYVSVDDILYLEAKFRCTKIVTSARTYLSSSNIGKFKKLEGLYNFYAVHRSYIVNVDRIKRYESGVLTVENGNEIPVSKSLRNDFLKMFNTV